MDTNKRGRFPSPVMFLDFLHSFRRSSSVANSVKRKRPGPVVKSISAWRVTIGFMRVKCRKGKRGDGRKMQPGPRIGSQQKRSRRTAIG